MAKLTSKIVGGWPVMEPLGTKETDLLSRNLAEGERVLGQVIGNSRQAVIATNPQLAQPASAPSIPEQSRALSELHSAGILTDDEFSAKKAELLSRM